MAKKMKFHVFVEGGAGLISPELYQDLTEAIMDVLGEAEFTEEGHSIGVSGMDVGAFGETFDAKTIEELKNVLKSFGFKIGPNPEDFQIRITPGSDWGQGGRKEWDPRT